MDLPTFHQASIPVGVRSARCHYTLPTHSCLVYFGQASSSQIYRLKNNKAIIFD